MDLWKAAMKDELKMRLSFETELDFMIANSPLHFGGIDKI